MGWLSSITWLSANSYTRTALRLGRRVGKSKGRQLLVLGKRVVKHIRIDKLADFLGGLGCLRRDQSEDADLDGVTAAVLHAAKGRVHPDEAELERIRIGMQAHALGDLTYQIGVQLIDPLLCVRDVVGIAQHGEYRGLIPRQRRALELHRIADPAPIWSR